MMNIVVNGFAAAAFAPAGAHRWFVERARTASAGAAHHATSLPAVAARDAIPVPI
ncbi:hypothetical protein [Williamsia deligens]|uniref:Uncharacterized protein n=1 Tax=Williamsia deligens TaxID=321325 RepID=A0ABW3G132_9NOCA|nr:hypothetical protein [Williamsia deligens]MCP2194847.1 hypothetical protein [Williamsia deligens]